MERGRKNRIDTGENQSEKTAPLSYRPGTRSGSVQSFSFPCSRTWWDNTGGFRSASVLWSMYDAWLKKEGEDAGGPLVAGFLVGRARGVPLVEIVRPFFENCLESAHRFGLTEIDRVTLSFIPDLAGHRLDYLFGQIGQLNWFSDIEPSLRRSVRAELRPGTGRLDLEGDTGPSALERDTESPADAGLAEEVAGCLAESDFPPFAFGRDSHALAPVLQ